MKTFIPYSMVKVEDWPPGCKRLVQARVPHKDPLAKRSKAVLWSESTFKLNTISLGYFIGWLCWTRRYAESLELASYVTREIMTAYIENMEKFGLSVRSIAHRLDGVRACTSALAPEIELSWLMFGINQLRRSPSDRRRTRERIQHTGDVVEVGMNLVRRAARDNGNHLLSALQIRDGVILVFMALVVPRLGVMPTMRVDEHLRVHGQQYKIAWSKAEMKSKQPYEALIGPELSALITHYLDVSRPLLISRNGDLGRSKRKELWITRDGEPLSANGIYKIVVRRTGAAFDEAIYPHALRHGAATTLATERPDLIDITTPLLQHTSVSSRQYYNLADSISASSAFGESLDQRRMASPEGRRLLGSLSRLPRQLAAAEQEVD